MKQLFTLTLLLGYLFGFSQKSKIVDSDIKVYPPTPNQMNSEDSLMVNFSFRDPKNPLELDSTEVHIEITSKNGKKHKEMVLLGSSGMLDYKGITGRYKITLKRPCTKSFKRNYHFELLTPNTNNRVYVMITKGPKVRPNVNYQVKKPVIYLYPSVTTSLTLSLETEADLTFTYPEYQNGWKLKATPEGKLSLNERTYPYLFWEGEMDLEKAFLEKDSGFVIQGNQSFGFFEDQLSKLGLNHKEQTDFITYWAPQLEKNESYFIRFLINDQYDQVIGSLNSSHPFDQEIRVYVLIDKTIPKSFKKQDIPQIRRGRNIIVEWGGTLKE